MLLYTLDGYFLCVLDCNSLSGRKKVIPYLSKLHIQFLSLLESVGYHQVGEQFWLSRNIPQKTAAPTHTEVDNCFADPAVGISKKQDGSMGPLKKIYSGELETLLRFCFWGRDVSRKYCCE